MFFARGQQNGTQKQQGAADIETLAVHKLTHKKSIVIQIIDRGIQEFRQ